MSMEWPNIEAGLNLKYGADKWHCDDIWRLKTAPDCVLAFLDVARAPAHGAGKPTPSLYATTKDGVRVRVTMASRFGDVGVRIDLAETHGYDLRLFLCELSDFSATK